MRLAQIEKGQVEGRAKVLESSELDIRCLTAPNASPMTQNGTNTYLVGRGDIAVIDPGPDDSGHLEQILAALRPGEKVTHILVTHSHLDHSPLAAPLSDRTGAPVYGFGSAHDGRSETMINLAKTSDIGGGEGIDADFAPDIRVSHGQHIQSNHWEISALHTPGHLSNHLCFAMNGAVFTGDHVMGWASSLVSPPDGDLGKFMQSCEMLRNRDDQIYYPGHGSTITRPLERVEWLIGHRRKRETEILDALDRGLSAVSEITKHIYHDVNPHLHRAASRNVLAHLIDLWERNLVSTHGKPGENGRYTLI